MLEKYWNFIIQYLYEPCHSREGGTRITDHAEHRSHNGELRAKLQSAEFWGLLFDGSEDITKTEQEIVYIV